MLAVAFLIGILLVVRATDPAAATSGLAAGGNLTFPDD
jgi:hypothetical protein